MQLDRAEKTIPLGSQTFSKSRTQYPVGASPLYLDRAKGAYCWDIDGNKYIDLVSSLACITLGFGNSRVNRAVSKQLKKGVTLSLPGIIEAEVAELLVEMIPSAEMVRFGKNGTDATSAAIRLSRAYTKKDHVIVCGYHGWQDWYIGSTTRDKGVPEEIKKLTHKFTYNNLDSLHVKMDELNGEVAAVIMEPMTTTFPAQGFLEGVRELTSRIGAVLIFDETITGFRFSNGGAQEFFGVTPDLSTFGKGMANGFPLSAVVGSRKIMMEMEEIFFSGTFGGELLSLAAAKETILQFRHNEIVNALASSGEWLASQIREIILQEGLGDVLTLSGHPSWTFLNWSGTSEYSVDEIKTYFMQEMFTHGVLVLNTHNITLAHTKSVLKKVVKAYEQVLRSISLGLKNQDLRELLTVQPVTPLFKVR
jgi:glutamate-1-semialdehyde 2,1-aminomutase